MIKFRRSPGKSNGPRNTSRFFSDCSKPSIDINITSQNPQPAASRFGGDPYVAADFTWPLHKVGRYRFLGQFNFEQVSPPSTTLPTSGLLSLFFADDDDGEVFWQDEGYVVGYYWEDLSNHVVMQTPSGIPISPEASLALLPGLNIPRHEELRNDWPFEGAADFAWDLSQQVNTDHYLLGYPSYCTLGYDPTPGPDWVPLLTLRSSSDLEWCWHDGDRLMVFIQAEHLQRKDFSMLKCDAG
ncbi:YwqG family protein [Massilia sp. TWP1-3-3]|uniref:YwqG family protein n=1 Tax=Massilia sp. TWP1-3-3 TaxID=2804573 RepID=UPI003CF76EEA